MTTPISPPTQEAEDTRALLNRTLAAHRNSYRRIQAAPRGRLDPPGRADAQAQELRQATLIRLLAITESFAAELLWRKTETATAAAAGSLAERLTGDAVINNTSSWHSQETAFRDWFGVKTDWKSVGAYAEVRNAAAHGLGRLTRRQLRKETSTVSKMTNVNVTVADGHIVLDEHNIDEAAAACLRFVLDLDTATASD